MGRKSKKTPPRRTRKTILPSPAEVSDNQDRGKGKTSSETAKKKYEHAEPRFGDSQMVFILNFGHFFIAAILAAFAIGAFFHFLNKENWKWTVLSGLIIWCLVGLAGALFALQYLVPSQKPSSEQYSNTEAASPQPPPEPSPMDRPPESKPPSGQTRTMEPQQAFQGDKSMSEKKPNSSSNENAAEPPRSINQSMVNSPGGIQAGGNVTITDIPEPKIGIRRLTEPEPFNDQYKTEYLLVIDSKVPIKNLIIKAEAVTIINVDTVPRQAGLHYVGRSGLRDGWAFTSIQNAYGSYTVIVLTKGPETCKLSYAF
jgi:hypothetical protein